nr:MAG TPA: hypothetical protein [Caudoviricetes sp.]
MKVLKINNLHIILMTKLSIFKGNTSMNLMY